MRRRDQFKPALRYRWLTRFYDPLLRMVRRRYDFFERFVTQAGIRPDDTVLDLGCGSGTVSILIKERYPDATVVGLDADAEILHAARRHAAEMALDIAFVEAMSVAMPFGEHRFDRVVSGLLFHHLTTETKRRTLNEIRRVLKPGGSLYILDWGKPQNLVLRLAFLAVQLFDSFDTTTDNVQGLIPRFMKEEGFEQVAETERIPTPGGSLSIYEAIKPP